jgi:hypothetical protein
VVIRPPEKPDHKPYSDFFRGFNQPSSVILHRSDRRENFCNIRQQQDLQFFKRKRACANSCIANLLPKLRPREGTRAGTTRPLYRKSPDLILSSILPQTTASQLENQIRTCTPKNQFSRYGLRSTRNVPQL